MKEKNLQYTKPTLTDMTDYEMLETNGGGFPVVIGALLVVVAVVAAVNVSVGGVLVVAGAMFNYAAEVNKLTVTMG